ncbi:hypothetical protein AgCh_039353 [Apium graveolens]
MAGRLKKKPAWNGHSFKSLFSTPPSNVDAVKDEVDSSGRKFVAKETSVNAEKGLVYGSEEEKVQTSKVEVSDSNRESCDVGSKCGNTATLSKRKRDLCTDLHASPGRKTNNEFETCVACSKRQRLSDGKYCKTSYHPSSSDTCTDDVLVGVLQCFQCLNNKMQAGSYPLSADVEAIWNARETEISDAEGLRKKKQYFVKYRGRAHIHNRWILESRLSPEAEKLAEEFNKQREAVKWNEEWVVPQRLLKKRLLLSPDQENGAPPGTSGCQYEWLVKWRGLNYESVTWELDSFLSSVSGASLIKEYENRHKKALDDPSSLDKDRNGSLVKLQKLPAGSPPGLSTSHLETVNKLREFLYKGQSAIVFDDKDRIIKTVLYIGSLSDICQPFLIITTSSLLPLWETEFLRALPSVDVVVYNGSSENRECIRTLEFYDDDGRIMLQVLLSSVEIVVEDFVFLDSIKWKVVIVDECEQPKVSSQFSQIKMLAANVKILLYNGLWKDNVPEYLSLLSMLETCGDSTNTDELKAESIDNLCKLRGRLSLYAACEGKSSSSKFLEFWVPSIISNAQLEQYCDTLLSNSISLCSNSRTDPIGALRDIVFSTRKSCDHPYIVDPSLKHLITKDLPPVNFLDAEIKASGKLQLLEMMLLEIKKRQLRVLILFQSVAGSGRDTLGLGDILDDFLRERFGADAYERVDGGFPSKSRQTALNNFNKGNGRFVFLLENRACLPAIKLVSVDTIIIYDSNWNPAHDVKSLNKISIDSNFKMIKIFRLYSAFTVEEKVLILAKQGLTLESNLESISRATSNTLLMWGASYLLDRLNKFHSTPDKNVSSEQELLSKVVDEISTLLSKNGECDGVDNSCILKIQQRVGIYSSSLKLLGEYQIQLSDEGNPHNFWTNLLNRRIPKWKFLSGRTERHRKKVQYSDEIPKNAECGTLEAVKKRKNGEPKCINPAISKPGLEQNKSGGASGIREDYGLCCSKGPGDTAADLVKPDLLKLCEILNFSDEVKIMAERLLDYVVSEHHVKSGSESISQAFLIALCWGSASLLKQKFDMKKSLFLAGKHLNFSCSEIEAGSVYYSAVRKLKKTFKKNILSDLCDNSISGVKRSIDGKLNENLSQLQTVKPELEEIRDQVHIDVIWQDEREIGAPVHANEISQDDERHEVEAENNFELIHKKCKKRIEKLKQKQEEEIKKMNEDWEVQRADIEGKQKVESIVYMEVFRQPYITDKLKISDNRWRRKLAELEHQKEVSLKELKAKHLDALSNEKSKVVQWLQSASPASFAAKVAGQDELALHLFGIQNGEYSEAIKHVLSNVSENDATLSRHHDDLESVTNINKMLPGRTCATDPSQDLRCNDLDVITENANCEDDQVKNMASENVPVARSQLPNPANWLPIVSENDLTLSKHADDSATDTNIDKMVPGSICVDDPNQAARCNSLNGIITVTENLNCKDGELDSMASKNVPVAKSQLPNGIGSATNGLENALSLSLHHQSENHYPDKTMSSPLGGMILPETPERSLEDLTDQIVEVNPLDKDQEEHLVENHPEILQEMVEDAEERPSQVQHLGSNAELLPPTDVLETPLQKNQPDLLSTSTLDHQPFVVNASLPNSEAVPQIIERTTELPRQSVITTGVDMSVVQGCQDLPLRAEHQVHSQILKLTSFSDPLQNELGRIQKETEQAIKLHEDAKMRLKSEFEELMAQLHRKYEDKCKDLDAVFQLKKYELDQNHSKVFMSEMLADALRSNCAQPSTYNGMQQGVHHGLVQPLNQAPVAVSTASRSSAITVTSSAGQPTGSQHNSDSILQPSSSVHPNITPTTFQPAASLQNTVSLSHGTQVLPVIASSSGSQPAVKQQRTTLLMQPEPGSIVVPDSSSAGQVAASQQNTSLVHPSSRISPFIISSSAVQPAASQHSTPPLQIVQHSAALFSSTPTRPPQINPITPSTGNASVGSENRARAPAPHLQAFRSASSINLETTLVMPSHLTQYSPSLSSHTLLHGQPCPSPSKDSKPPN